MSSSTVAVHTLTIEISKVIISDMASEEMSLFDEMTQEYFANPIPPKLSAKPSDDPLGFGAGEIIVAATPAVLSAVSTVLAYIQSDLLKAASSETVGALKKKIQTLFGPEHEEKSEPPPLTKEQLELIKTLAQRQAKAFGMPAHKARHMAEALVGILALKI